jgi:threonylcarbamoyladenosine tRNA methylthiotransferase MtaB
VAEEVGFSKIHIFPFSARRGTPAAEMTDQVQPAAKSDRTARLAALERQLRERYFSRLVGRKLRVLVESPHPARPGWLAGTACRYAPVHIPTGNLAAGDLSAGNLSAGTRPTKDPMIGRLVDLVIARAAADHLEAAPASGPLC